MNRCNYNQDITIRALSRGDLYDRMYVQSGGNTDHIYRLEIHENGNVYHKAEYRIQHRCTGDFIEYETNSKVDRIYYTCWSRSLNVDWYETHYSKRLNLDVIREEKLNLLGI